MNLKQLIEEQDTRPGRLFDLCIQGLIVLSLVSFTIETLPDLSPRARTLLGYFEVFTVIVFSMEYEDAGGLPIILLTFSPMLR